MTVWGGFAGHMRVGIDVWTDGYDANSTQVWCHVQLHAQCQSNWNFADNQHVQLSGDVGGGWDFYNNLGPNGIYNFPVVSFLRPLFYGGGPTLYFHGELSGNYLGVNSGVDYWWAVPARPIRPPAPPSSNPGFDNVTATSMHVFWGGTPDAGGSGPDVDELQIATDGGFGGLVYDTIQGGSDRWVSGLAPGRTYFARSRIHNAAGWSGWSGTTARATLPFTVGRPGVGSIQPDSALVTWAAPAGGTPTGYELQYALDAGFTNGVQTLSSSWATSRTVAGLNPATDYYVRVRASTSTGWGAWSDAAAFRTLSGAKARVGNGWVNAVPFIRHNGKWAPAKVWKGVNGDWHS